MTAWAADALFYHVYPLGLCGAPEHNDGQSPPEPRLLQLLDWLPHWKELGINALYLGPVFESMTHGYDTVDYFQVDRRLGSVSDLRELVRRLHQAGIRVVLDAVYNHVGRRHPAFLDVQRHGAAARHASWISGLRFDRRSPMGDPFSYDTWHGAYELPKLDLTRPEVREHLLAATQSWIAELDIDGLRLDAADCLKPSFLRELALRTRALKPDFWLMGEVVHGDYRRWAGPGLLDAATNYEAYKSLYSAHNDRNYFEIAHTLQRQFGPEGLYRDLSLYAFADNHDVNRLASILRHRPHLYPLYLMLFTMPGVPSIYYGSEWGLEGRKQRGSDRPLRPALHPQDRDRHDPDLARTLGRFAALRRELPALRHGAYLPLHVAAEQLAFLRQAGDQAAIVAINGASHPAELEVAVDSSSRWADALNPGAVFEAEAGRLRIPEVPPTWGRVLVPA